MELGVCSTWPATPSLPLPPRPTGQLTEVFEPTLLFHSGLTFERKSVHTKLVPLPSERCTTVMSALGSFTPGLSLVRAGSFHLVILPRKISASTWPENLRSAVTPSILYVGTTP